MKQPLNRQQIGNGIHFTQITDEKFKRNRIAIHCLLPLDPKTASENAMIPLLVRKGSTNIPEDSNVFVQLNHLYGATLGGNTSRYNQYQRLSFYIQSLDNRYAMKEEDLVSASVHLLLDCFFHPNFQKDFEVERQYLMDTIEAEINDKRSYALSRGMEEMFRDEVIATPQYGTLETAAVVTPEAVQAAWKRMIDTASIEILFTGSGNPEPAVKAISSAFAQIDRHPLELSLLELRDTAQKVTETTEPMDGIQQGKLVMGFRCAGLNTQQDKDAGRVFSALYGGTPFSKLFMNVREKLSLCYYCAARLDTINNFLLVDSGVEFENKEKAQAEILVQLQAVQNGEITEEELANTKMLLANAIQNTEDTLGGTESWYLGQILKNQETTPAEDVENINKVTIEDVVRIAKGVTLDTIYFLAGKEEA